MRSISATISAEFVFDLPLSLKPEIPIASRRASTLFPKLGARSDLWPPRHREELLFEFVNQPQQPLHRGLVFDVGGDASSQLDLML
jgi:hypothetical protein